MKKSFLLLLVVFGSYQAFSQKKSKKEKKKDTIVEVINVITSYTPTIADAFKIKKSPRIVLSKNSEKQKLTYSIFSAPVASTFVPKSGVVKGIDVGKKERLFDNYVAGGFGNYTTPFIEAFLHQNRKFDDDYGIYLKYISSEGGVESTPLDNGYSNLKVGAYYLREERYFTWKIGGNIDRRKYNWYGLPNAITFDTASITSILEEQNYGLYELEGELLFEDSYFDDIKASISLFDDKFGSKEIRFSLKPNFKVPLDGINRRWKDLDLKTSIEYLKGEFQQSYLNSTNVNYSFFTLGLNPIYRLEYKDFHIKLGTKVYLSSDIENSLTDFFIYPDVQVTYPLISKLANIYAGATGDIHMNSFQSFSEENPYVSPTLFLTQTNEQYNIFGGINGKFSSNVSFDIKASYKSDEDRALFVRNNSKSNGTFDATNPLLGYEYGNSFSVFYDDISTLSIFAELEVDVTKRLIIGGNVQSNTYTTTFQRKAWNLPKLEGAIFGKYKKDKWYASANIFFIGERLDQLYSGTFPSTVSGIQNLDAFVDVNLNGGYHFNDLFSAFIKLNNVLGTDYERYANFNVQGFQVLAGVTYKFDF